jgi:hypothetical protein
MTDKLENILILAGVRLAFLVFSSLVTLLGIQPMLERADWFSTAMLYLLGLLSSYVGFSVVAAFYTGTLYRMATLGLTVVAYVVFCFQPLWANALFFK